MTLTGWLLAAAIALTAADSRGSDATQAEDVIPGYVCTHEYQPWITPDICFGPHSYDWRGKYGAVMVENGTNINIQAAAFWWDSVAHTSGWIYHDTVLPPGGNVQWQESWNEGNYTVYVWCEAPKLPRIHNANGQGYCL